MRLQHISMPFTELRLQRWRLAAAPGARFTAARAARRGGADTRSSSNSSTTTLPLSEWPPVLLRLALCGGALGTALDGIHSAVALQVYDLAPLHLQTPLGVLETSWLVPPLLATWYAVMGALFLTADANAAAASDNTTAGPAAVDPSAATPAHVAAAYGLLAANLELSAYLYSNGTPYGQIAAALSVTCGLTWWLLDRTPRGAALAAVCAAGAPAAELVLMAVLHTWHYSKPDVLGGAFVSFVPLCYAGYVPVLGYLTRYLASQQRRRLM